MSHTHFGNAMLNGKPLEHSFIRRDEIMTGGESHYTIQAEANRQ